MRDTCESYTRKPHRAKICVIWERAIGKPSNEIVHRHLCGSHANVLVNGFDKGDTWTEQTLEECAKNV